MFAFCMYVALFLCARVAILCLYKRKITAKDLLLILYFVALLFAVWSAANEKFPSLSPAVAAAALFFVGELYLRQKKKELTRVFSFLFVLCFTLLCFAQIGLSNLPYFYEGKTVAKIAITGRVKHISVEWKSPSCSMQKKTFPAYEVKLESLDGQLLGSDFVYGELVGVRAKIIRLHPILTFMGLPSLYRIDGLCNDYLSFEKRASYPHQAFALDKNEKSGRHFFQKTVWRLWESLFFQNGSFPLIKSTTLEALYFPLADKDGKPITSEHRITVSSGGMSSQLASH